MLKEADLSQILLFPPAPEELWKKRFSGVKKEGE